jgi:hypothetical protein
MTSNGCRDPCASGFHSRKRRLLTFLLPHLGVNSNPKENRKPMYCRVFLLCALGIIAFRPTAAVADSSGDAALAKYKTYVGWTLGDAGTRSLRITGKIADLNSFDEICEHGRFAQFDIGSQSGRSFLVASDQGSVWISHGGVANTFPDQVAKDALTENLLLCNDFANYPSTVISTVDSPGTNSKTGYSVVAVQPPNTPAIIITINNDTGEPTSFVIDGIATYEPADLKSIGATRKIFTRWKRVLPDGSTADMTISTLQLNVIVNPAMYTRQALDVPPSPDPAPIVHF